MHELKKIKIKFDELKKQKKKRINNFYYSG